MSVRVNINECVHSTCVDSAEGHQTEEVTLCHNSLKPYLMKRKRHQI